MPAQRFHACRGSTRSQPPPRAAQRPGEGCACPSPDFIPQGRPRAARDAVGKRFGGVDIANGDDELAPVIALRRHAEGGDGQPIGDFHRRSAPGGNCPTASGRSDTPQTVGPLGARCAARAAPFRRKQQRVSRLAACVARRDMRASSRHQERATAREQPMESAANHPRPHRGEPDGVDAPSDRGGPPPRRSQSLRVRPAHSGRHRPQGGRLDAGDSTTAPAAGRAREGRRTRRRPRPVRVRQGGGAARATSTRSSSRRCPNGCRSGCGVT